MGDRVGKRVSAGAAHAETIARPGAFRPAWRSTPRVRSDGWASQKPVPLCRWPTRALANSSPLLQ